METTEKKPKNGFDRLKVKYAKLKEENDTLKDLKTAADKFADEWKRRYDKKKEELETAEATINKQASKISELSGDLANTQSEAREYRSKFEEAVRRMGWLRRLWYGYDIPQFTNEDHWHD